MNLGTLSTIQTLKFFAKPATDIHRLLALYFRHCSEVLMHPSFLGSFWSFERYMYVLKSSKDKESKESWRNMFCNCSKLRPQTYRTEDYGRTWKLSFRSVWDDQVPPYSCYRNYPCQLDKKKYDEKAPKAATHSTVPQMPRQAPFFQPAF